MDGSINITVLTLVGGELCQACVSRTVRVATLKAEIQAMCAIPIVEQLLLHDGAILLDSQSISDMLPDVDAVEVLLTRQLNPKVTKLINDLQSKDAAVREAGIKGLNRLSDDLVASAVPALEEAILDESKAQLCIGIISAFQHLANSNADIAIPALLKALAAPRYAECARYSLLKIGLPALLAARSVLEDANPQSRYHALKLFLEFGEKALGTPEVQDAISTELAKPSHVAKVKFGLKDSEADVRQVAAEVLAQQCAAADGAADFLAVAMTEDSSLGVRRNAAIAIGRLSCSAISSEVIMESLGRALHDTDNDVPRYAAKALGQLGPDASPLVPDLQIALTSKNRDLRWEAAKALGQIGAEARPAIPALSQVVSCDEYFMVRKWAVWSLGQLHELEPLKAALNDTSEHVREAAADVFRVYLREVATDAPQAQTVCDLKKNRRSCCYCMRRSPKVAHDLE